jgi:hypothetical protein
MPFYQFLSHIFLSLPHSNLLINNRPVFALIEVKKTVLRKKSAFAFANVVFFKQGPLPLNDD